MMCNFFNRKGRKEGTKVAKLCEPCETFAPFAVKKKLHTASIS
jgi:hypothetical protein